LENLAWSRRLSKGYQWPFHAARLQDRGSSLIDIAVHGEIAEGRRVFVDFTRNPTPSASMKPFRIADLPEEPRRYLERSGAVQNTPYERLRHMNPQSIEIFAEHGVDLREPLEPAARAQHCNGGLMGGPWWESNIRHLFPVGELAGTHGVRPGGSALNSGQVGAIRAAQYIANVYRNPPLHEAATEDWRAIVDTHMTGAFPVSRTPAGRWGRPEELVGALRLLASEASSFINGQVITVDGGLLAVM